MKIALLPAALALFCTVALAEGGAVEDTPAANADAPPKELVTQVDHLVALLRDGFATGYPEATMSATLNTSPSSQLTLAVFTVEGFAMGNSYNQYLAVFEPDANEAGDPHYRLIDTLQIGGDNFRAIQDLTNASVSRDENTGVIQLNLPALANTEDDSPNFPSQPVVIALTLEHDRLAEVKP
ncbi:hypothetical protein [Pseudomonas turukhanskensis]|uniref:Uncharacterized protein n=1 Tax=Pseudomonas turukhanskensis TaxID=1806536 RepID=A0A9W6K9H8_9PSED|nr:hypothetical protein [Pseudomonas turukhanskensis]GLK91921.1 hypothetical protein GCM10017655_49850 [Pseudomonas turukhanskensis]